MKQTKRFLSMILLVAIVLLLSAEVFANAAEPPRIIMNVIGAPADMTIEVLGRSHRVIWQQRLWETQYRWYFSDSPQGAIFTVSSSEKTFTVTVPKEVHGYNKLMTLDYQKETLVLGEPGWRQLLLVTLRVLLTLLIEGGVFWLFGYRKRGSWMAFILVNLVTQCALNIAIVNDIRFSGYWMLGYILGEAAVFTAEAIILPRLAKEKSVGQGVICALAANMASLVLGGMLLSYLPI